ncbi:UNVERIFIED_CONTAM: hypothetical protein Sangu_1194000 [Sesamum angustifolium]|uniref:Reverse transcriptase zinc-binding domain-containing protein n=1 Tax=Sesamum angustifolium TaxID=2727405 RepID=A0AAW2NIE0_9LAMI
MASRGRSEYGFLSSTASTRFQTNLIRKITHSNGTWVTTEEGIKQCISAHFGGVYASNRPQPEAIAKGTEHLRAVLDASMAKELLQPYTATEVKKALFQMAPRNPQGPTASPNNCQTIREVAHSKRDLFATIRDRIWQKITGWNDKLLSQEGKEILIKAVLQAVPSYAMGCFRLPVSLLKELQGSRPSFTWRSVMAAYDLFRAGCRWRVGSGTQIQLWVDPWLPRSRSFRAITLVPSSLTEVRVADLIDHTCNDWNLSKVKEMFWPVDSDIILSIPIGRTGAPDLLIWHYSRSGIFSVRSAYHLACSLELRSSSSSSHVLGQSWWRRVWQAKIPNKVKVFVWRACLNALPTGDNLARRIPNTLAKCPFCGCSKEDRMHIFVLCPFARQVWGLSSIPLSFTSLQIPDFWAWMQAVAAGLDGVNFGFFLCMCWSIWWCRNGAGFQSSSRWTAPPPGCIKLNFDGATFRMGMELGAGVVARDKDGDCVAWLSRRFDRMGNAEIAETLAAREAIHLVVQQPDFSVTSPIVADIQAIASNFQFCTFEFVSRSCNAVAHGLAQSAQNPAEGGLIAPPAVISLVNINKLGK